MGDDDAVVDPVTVLRAQVNRFMGPGAPKEYRFRDTKLPATGPLDIGLAIHALTIFHKRAADIFSQDGGELIRMANAGYADAVGFVEKNLDTVTKTIAIYADIHGLQRPTTGGGKMFGLPAPLVIGAAALTAYLLLTRRR